MGSYNLQQEREKLYAYYVQRWHGCTRQRVELKYSIQAEHIPNSNKYHWIFETFLHHNIQVFEQLKKTCYRPVTTILASRNLSCVKYKDQFQGAQLVNMCQVATGAKKQREDIEEDEAVPPCGYYRRLKESLH